MAAGMIAMLTGTPTQTALAKVRADRAQAERRIAELEAERQSKLLDSGDVAEIDQIDADIAAGRRSVAICGQRIAVLEAEERRHEREEREQRRGAAVKVIASKYRKRQAIAQQIEDTLAHVAELYNALNDTKEIRDAFPFAESLPHYFNWQCVALQWETVRTMGRACHHMFPAEVRNAIAASHAGDGVTRAAAPATARGVAEIYAAHAAHVLNTLAKLNVHPPGEDDADNEEAA
jgi:hypothetical protein